MLRIRLTQSYVSVYTYKYKMDDQWMVPAGTERSGDRSLRGDAAKGQLPPSEVARRIRCAGTSSGASRHLSTLR